MSFTTLWMFTIAIARGYGKNQGFCKSMAKHSKRNKPKGGGYMPACIPKTKWGNIQKDVLVFFGCYNAVVAFNTMW